MPHALHLEAAAIAITVGPDIQLDKLAEPMITATEVGFARVLKPRTVAPFQPSWCEGVTGRDPCVEGSGPQDGLRRRPKGDMHRQFVKAGVRHRADGGNAIDFEVEDLGLASLPITSSSQ